MGKRKTLKDKKRTDARSIFPSSGQDAPQTPTPTHTYSFTAQKAIHQPVRPISQQNDLPLNTFVMHDLQKTLILSSIIVILQMALFLLLQNHILAIPFLRY